MYSNKLEPDVNIFMDFTDPCLCIIAKIFGSSLLSMLICHQIDSWQGIEPKICCC
jgi:hypothetical protein